MPVLTLLAAVPLRGGAPSARMSGEFVSQSIPTSAQTLQILGASVTVRNTGETPWDSSVSFVFVRRQFLEPAIPLEEGESVAPGATRTYRFSLLAPSTPGEYVFQARLKAKRRFISEPFPEVRIQVTSSETGNDAKFVSQEVPTRMAAGGSYPVRIVMRNTGRTTWTARQGYALHFGNPSELSHTKAVRIPLDPGDSIRPGQTKAFDFPFDANLDSSPFRWRMVQTGMQYFGEPSKLAKINRAAIFGNLDAVDCKTIAGWASDIGDYSHPQRVMLFADGVEFAVVTADRYRSDLAAAHHGHGNSGFELFTPAFLLDGKGHSIQAFVAPTHIQLTWSPKPLTCAPGQNSRPSPR